MGSAVGQSAELTYERAKWVGGGGEDPRPHQAHAERHGHAAHRSEGQGGRRGRRDLHQHREGPSRIRSRHVRAASRTCTAARRWAATPVRRSSRSRSGSSRRSRRTCGIPVVRRGRRRHVAGRGRVHARRRRHGPGLHRGHALRVRHRRGAYRGALALPRGQGDEFSADLVGRGLPNLVAHEALSREHKVVASVDEDLCVGCGACVIACRDGGIRRSRSPRSATARSLSGSRWSDDEKCIGCGFCRTVCPVSACIAMRERERESAPGA